MAWTDYETARVTLIEKVLADLQVAVSNLAAKQQMRQLLLIKQEEVDSLRRRVEELERLLIIIENSLK